MRRQLKPFVTEYRGAARRRDPAPSGNLAPETGAPRNRSFAEADRAFHNAPSADDSYEAALRAADALFSATASRSDVEPRAVQSSPAPLREATNGAHHATVHETATPAIIVPPAERDPVTPPRRILQAIEPEEHDRFAALEAERAPKRRGRKPGSKNKPKVVMGDDWGAPIPRPAAATLEALPVTARTVRGQPATALLPPSFFPDPGPEEPDEQPADPLLPPRGRNDKFRRKREGLRPGERWKRRLPKAAW